MQIESARLSSTSTQAALGIETLAFSDLQARQLNVNTSRSEHMWSLCVWRCLGVCVYGCVCAFVKVHFSSILGILTSVAMRSVCFNKLSRSMNSVVFFVKKICFQLHVHFFFSFFKRNNKCSTFRMSWTIHATPMFEFGKGTSGQKVSTLFFSRGNPIV